MVIRNQKIINLEICLPTVIKHQILKNIQQRDVCLPSARIGY